MIQFHLITLFPEACDAYLSASILGRARKEKYISVDYQTPRDYVDNKWGKVDERPYGGGPGMVMTALPVVRAVKKALARRKDKKVALIWFSPSGTEFTNTEADKLLKYDDVVLVCGRYEGIDDRAKKIMKSFGMVKNYSVGSATYTGAEVYTRPESILWEGKKHSIPKVLATGNHAEIEKWKKGKQ
jgi:tRNA (guanine37-N1)-methyltransferase